MSAVEKIEVLPQKGIVGNGRYFGRTSQRTGEPGKREVSLIGQEQIAEHATALGLTNIPAGAVRSNIETQGIDLMSLLGRQVQVGEALLFFYEARTPCQKMDHICQGLRALMEHGRQGMLAQVVRGGIIQIGDPIIPL